MSTDNRALREEHRDRLLSFENISAGYRQKEVLKDFTWSLERGRSWAVLGDNGSGKSTLLKLIRGDLMPLPGRGEWSYRVRGKDQRSPLGFKERTRLVSSEMLDAYRRNGWNLACREVVLTGFGDTVYLQEKPGPEALKAADTALARVGLARLAGAGINSLSQGQAKRVLLARALVSCGQPEGPEILLLDEVCEGLDGASRARLLGLVQKAAQSGVAVVQAVHRFRELIPAVSGYLRLENGRAVEQGPISQIRRAAPFRGFGTRPAAGPPPESGPAQKGRELFRLKGVDVFIDNKRILKNLDWSLCQGQHWAVLGDNGSGKSTLMRLLAGDLRTALGGVIVRFSDPKLKNIWQLRQRVSLVSAHYQAAHKYPETALQVVLGGFLGGIGVRFEPTPKQRETALGWLERFGLGGMAGEEIAALSYGQIRRVLLAKAMVTEPEILLLDESTGGLDLASRKAFLGLIDGLAGQGRTIIQATHYRDELASCLTHAAILEKGGFASQGPLGSGPGLLSGPRPE